jgi:hypothetical protein
MDVSAQIQVLMEQIAALQAQLKALQAQQGTTTAWCHTFNANMGYGASGSNFNALLIVLDKESILDNSNPKTEYDEIVGGAVVKLQEKYGILRTGYVGPKTRAKLNALYGCAPSTQSLITVTSPQANSSVNFPLTVVGSINSNWGRFEGTAGTAQLYFWVGSMMAGDWQKIGTPVSIIVDNWTSPTTNFHFTVNFNNSGIGLANGTKMKIILTEENASGLGTPDTFELPIILNITTQPSITVTSPNGGEVWRTGETKNITWNYTQSIYNEFITIDLYNYSSVGMAAGTLTGPTITRIANFYNTQNATSYSWTIPANLTGSLFKIKIAGQVSGGAGETVSDASDNYFTIASATVQPSITVISPSAGTYAVGATTSISWNSTGLPVNALVSIGLNGVTSSMVGAQIATNVLASSGSYPWTIPSFLGENLAGKTYNAYVTCINCSTPVGGVGSAFAIAAP